MSSGLTVLVLTNELDLHANGIVLALERRGARPIRFNPADFPQRSRLYFSNQNGKWHGYIDLGRRRLDPQEIHSAWLGRPDRVEVHSTLSPMAARFAKAESRAAIEGVLHLDHILWINHPDRVRVGERKLVQLQRASALGFEVPRTLVTNDAAAVETFYEECGGNIVFKTLSSPLVSEEKMERGMFPPGSIVGTVYTTPVEEADLAHLRSATYTANLFQEYVPKEIELRVTVVGNRVFAAEIHSQASERTRHDWRHYDFDNTPHCVHQLPLPIARLCVELTKSFGLVYGAIDMVLTPNGRYMFLEINPVGLWHWIELLTGLPITDAIADLLVAGQVRSWEPIVETVAKA
jgi:glutathione synthase/RimK-type ligase-like ATP-grasp enzyme